MRNIHILPCLTLSLLFGVCLMFSSCRGSGGKKVATEAIEFFEKEAGGIERNATRLEKGASSIGDDASKVNSKTQERYSGSGLRRAKKASEQIDGLFGEDEEPERMPQPVAVICPQCQGAGMVYMTDMYGNVVFDYYGNPQVVPCPNCGGTGQVVTYQ